MAVDTPEQLQDLRARSDELLAEALPQETGRLASLKNASWLPVLLLVVVVALSLGARIAYINQPCDSPCRSAGLVFDEQYYVNAARTILGRPVTQGLSYAGTPAHTDPNSEHPQLGKIIIAVGMLIFGDRPLGWRFGSIEFGTAAILGMYLLVRAAKGGRWLALGAASIMALDNLLLIHGRIATLDIYAVTFMIFGAFFYLKKRPIIAGVVLGIGATTKLVVFFLFTSLIIFELFRRMQQRKLPWWYRDRSRRLVVVLAVCLVTYFAALGVLDAVVKPYDEGSRATYTNPISHTKHMLDFAAHQTSPKGPQGIASYPWMWLLNKKPINYYSVTQNSLVDGKVVAQRNTVAFSGAMNPFLVFVAIPALFLAIAEARRRREVLDTFAVAWFAGTYVPFVVLSAIEHRTSYLYYMVIVMPALYMAAARLFSSRYLPRAARVGWALALIFGFVSLYPIRTLTP